MDASTRCSTCHHLRPLTDLNVRAASRDGLPSRCRDCSRQWYAAHRDVDRANVRRRSTATKEEHERRIGEHRSAHPCVDCGEADVRVLDFDHREAADKRADIAWLVNAGGRWSDIEREIATCEVRCADCHRRVTSHRGQDWRAVLATDVRAVAAERRSAAGDRAAAQRGAVDGAWVAQRRRVSIRSPLRLPSVVSSA